jgi:pimeloyl-ACP methyl ester carboxylesterase
MEGSRSKRRLRSAVGLFLSLMMLAGIAALSETPAGASAGSSTSGQSPAVAAQGTDQTPIVFVHGYLGSGAQYQDQAMRFASNGLPANRIRAFDYNYVATGLDQFIDQVRQEFGVQKVNVAAHSLGTMQMFSYLLNGTTAAKVNAYVALDGIGALCFYGTRCTSISASSLGQTHVEASLSPESFQRQFQHFYGRAPSTTSITPQSGQIQIGGRALYFQENTPASGTAGELWQINPQTGARVGSSPAATFNIGADGNFGPLNVQAGQPYEIQLSRSDTGVLHYYYQPWPRSTHLLRLQVIKAGSQILTNTRFSNDHAAGVVLRYREWWRASSHGNQREDLTFSQQSSAGNVAARNILENQTADVVGVHIHDDAASPRQTTLNALNYFSTQAFQTGRDVYMPASGNGPNGTMTFSNNPRGDASRRQTINIPNWPSMIGNTRHGFLVEFNSYVQ